MFDYAKYAKIRDKKNLTDYRVCKELGINTPSMTGWKKGRYEPKYDNLLKIARFLEVEISDITRETA